MNDLFCVCVSGVDNIYAVSSRSEAYDIAQQMNQMFINESGDNEKSPLYPIVWARPMLWRLGKEAHEKDIAKNGNDWRQWPS